MIPNDFSQIQNGAILGHAKWRKRCHVSQWLLCLCLRVHPKVKHRMCFPFCWQARTAHQTGKIDTAPETLAPLRSARLDFGGLESRNQLLLTDLKTLARVCRWCKVPPGGATNLSGFDPLYIPAITLLARVFAFADKIR